MNQHEEWERNFDEKFENWRFIPIDRSFPLTVKEKTVLMLRANGKTDEIKSFIREELSKARAQERAEVEEAIERLRNQNKEARPADYIEEVDERAYNAALNDVLAALKNKP